MKYFRVFIINVLFVACSPQGLPNTPIPSVTIPKYPVTSIAITSTPIPTTIITPNPPELIESKYELPPDCSNYDPSLDPGVYADFSHGTCNNPAISPNETQIAYASLKIIESGKITQEARLYSRSNGQTSSLYISKCGILYPEWTSKSILVISDYPQDVGCGHTIIYDTEKGTIIATLEGAAHRGWRNYWSKGQNAFFTLSPELSGPICSETLSGFDLSTNQSFPIIKTITPNTNLYVVIGEPIWAEDGKSLLAALRDGTCTNLEKFECIYSNAYIISIDLNGDSPVITYPFRDPERDYSFGKLNEGNPEIKSTPTKVVNCLDINNEESKP